MKLLILTQKVDRNDPILGFFHNWIKKFSERYEKITVICLEQGEYNLPANVRVLSLGKEKLPASPSGRQATRLAVGQASYKLQALKKLRYIVNFFRYVWQERKNYDAVFVHMNQEYVLLGGKLWLLLGKKVFMWRNHHVGDFLTDIAAFFCSKVFCTSKYSYTAKYKKTVLMPVGIDTDLFFAQGGSASGGKPITSFLFLGRIAPSKNVDVFIEALGLLKKRGANFSASIYGDALPKDIGYFKKLKSRARELGLDNILKFHAGVPNRKTPEVYDAHEIFINLSSSGMYDKTIFEAMACGCLVLASNDNLKGQIDERLIIDEREAKKVAEQLSVILSLSAEEKKKIIEVETAFAMTNNLQTLTSKLFYEISSADISPYAKLLKYIISGGTAAFIDLLFLFLFTSVLHIWYIASAVLAFLIAFGVSFFLQKFWTFSDLDTRHWKTQMAKYFLITAINLGLNTLLMYIFVDYAGIQYLLAQIITSILVAGESYFVYQILVFKPNE